MHRLLLLSLAICICLGGIARAQDDPAAAPSPASEAKRIDVDKTDLAWHVLSLSAEELSATADAWHEHLSTNLEAISRVETWEPTSEAAEGEQVPLLGELLGKNDEIMDRYGIVLSAWERKGGTGAQIDEHRSFIQGSIAQVLRSAGLTTVLTILFYWVFSWHGGLSLIMDFALLVGAVFLIILTARAVKRLTRRQLERKLNRPILQVNLFSGVAYWLTVLVGFLFLVVRSDLNLTIFAAVVGGVGFLLAVSMQNSLGNIASGILLTMFRPFDLGQIVRIGDVLGWIDDFGPSATIVRQFDNLLVRVPNEQVWRSRVDNYSAVDRLRIELVFNIGFPQDQERALNALRRVVSREPRCKSDTPPDVFVAEIGEASIAIYCRAWVDAADYWRTAWALTAAGVDELHRSGIQIANPFHDVRLHPSEAPT